MTGMLHQNAKPIDTTAFHSTTIPGAYELSDITEILKQETEVNVMIGEDKKTTKCKMELKWVLISTDV